MRRFGFEADIPDRPLIRAKLLDRVGDQFYSDVFVLMLELLGCIVRAPDARSTDLRQATLDLVPWSPVPPEHSARLLSTGPA
jgi:hypothetical protein